VNIILTPLLLASLITFISINLLRPLAISINLIDTPSMRKPHKGSIPLIGGISMFLGVIITILTTSHNVDQFRYFLLTSLMIVIIGILDDHKNISVSLRLMFQAIVGIIMVTVGGINIESFGNLSGNGPFLLNQWAYFVTVIAIISSMNAVNMADGMHGLAGGNSLITFLAILYLSIDKFSQESLFIALLFCAVLPIFLIHNLCLGIHVKKRIFMGDSGSMFIGLSIVWVLIDLSQGANRSFAPVTALWLFAIPLIEFTTAIFRRLTLGLSPFRADLLHTHHILLKLGFSEKNALLLILLVSLIMAIFGILGELYGVSERAMFIGFLASFGFYVFTYMLALKKIQKTPLD
jgi:UDP-GlcNAc:undecaprenyl-phosphate/decaprenyl-phosphate GlcNAc-1-phosphate transferase